MRDELAESEGEPGDESDALAPGEMPGEHGRVLRLEDAWRLKLVMNEKKICGRYVQYVESVHANVTTILTHHPLWLGCVVYDEFRETVAAVKDPPWDPEDAPERVAQGAWTDEDTLRLSSWLVRAERLKVRGADVEAGLSVAAHKRRVHPVRAYLRGLVWDRTPRLDGMLSDYFGTDDGLYERGVGSKWMISAVARIMQPGSQVDCTLIVEGWQGAKKSSGFRALVPNREWYSETGVVIGTKDSYGALHAVWIYGFDELDSVRRGDTTKTKSFLTATSDKYRPPYGHRDKIYLRQTVFCGTTNEETYLPDRTGNRRYHPVRCRRTVDVTAIERDRDQLWAEAVVRFDAGEKWYVDTPGLQALCSEQQAERVIADPWVEMIAAWLATPTQLSFDGGTDHREPLDTRKGVTTCEVLTHCLGMRKGDVDTRHEMRVGAALRELGYGVRRERDGTARVRRYVQLEQAELEQAELEQAELEPTTPELA